MVPCKSTAEEVSFERSHHRISSILNFKLKHLNVTPFCGHFCGLSKISQNANIKPAKNSYQTASLDDGSVINYWYCLQRSLAAILILVFL